MALIFRAYYAMIKSPRITSKGVNTSAILGFTNTLVEIIKNEKPTHIAVSFDTGAPTLRHADFPEYKANRDSTPSEIIESIPYIKSILSAFNIPVISLDGYEADDVIGTIAKKAEIEGFTVYMMTSDKDYGQLVSDNIYMYKPAKFGQKAEVVGVKEICEKYSIAEPEELIDILGLWGDASDNIPGVPNIGEVKAKKLVQQFHSIENIYQHIEEVENEKLRQTLIDNQDKAIMSKMLATIILDVPVSIDFEAMKMQQPQIDQLKSIFNELEFRALSQRIFKDLGDNSKQTTMAPDLFSVLEQPKEEPSEFQCFEKCPHHFQQIYNIGDIANITPNQSLFFEWILINEKIAGFAFCTTKETIYYHLLERQNSSYQDLFKFIFKNERTIISYQIKETYKILKKIKLNYTATFFDIQIAHYLIQPERSHLIERLAEFYLNYTPLKEIENSDLKRIIEITNEKVEIYSALYPLLIEEMKQNDLQSLFEKIEMPLAEVLADMELTGVKLDVDELTKNAEALDNDIKNLESKIFELAGETFNIASPKQLGMIIFEKLKIIENAKLTKSKQYQTGEEILVKLTNKHPIVPLILEWRTLSKLKSTYIAALPQLINPKTGRIHTTFQQTVTSTGRLSSTNPNLQNIPIRTERGKEIRKAFIASSPERVILAADYSQVELRIAASLANDESMISAFEQHNDIHTATAAKVFKIAPEEVTAEQRRYAKTVNFGILYGISSFGLSERLHCPLADARTLIENYNNSFPNIKIFMNELMQNAHKNGFVETLLRRRRYIRNINSPNAILRKGAERNAINAPIQGTAADMIKIAMINIFNEIKKRNFESKMILQVHDELVFDVPLTELEEMQKIVSNFMQNAIHLKVDLEVSLNYGKNWYESH